MKYDTYVNPPGGKTFLDANKYKKANIELEFLTQEIQKYNQRIREFVPGLSILDVMMFCTPEEIRSMTVSYTHLYGMRYRKVGVNFQQKRKTKPERPGQKAIIKL